MRIRVEIFDSNPKSEYRNTKQIQITQYQNLNSFVLIIRILNIFACFGFVPYGHSHPDCIGTGSRFRASYLEF